MIAEKIYAQRSLALNLKNKARDYSQLIKLRLNLTVVFSSFIGFLIADSTDVNWFGLMIVSIGGFLTVGAANGINQIIEKDSDKLMRRTENRPLAQDRMSIGEAAIACMLMGAAGVLLISYNLNWLSGFLALISLCLYGFVYTPLKRLSPIAVHVGAIPGALPTIIGYVAASGKLDAVAWTLFIIQVLWQFPHFYAIAWLLDDDYKRAGLKMLPLGAAKDKKGAIQIAVFTGLLLPVCFVPVLLGFGSLVGCILLCICSLFYFGQSIKLLNDLGNKSAKQLMFTSFVYLPVVFIIMFIDKIL